MRRLVSFILAAGLGGSFCAVGLARAAEEGDFRMFGVPLPDPDGGLQTEWDFPPLRPLGPEAVNRLGAGVSRTMHLLASSTAERRNHVRVVVYGQSLSKQSWAGRVRDELVRRYPHADLEFHNLAIGGFVSTMLKRTLEHDVIPLYPDLVILHDFGPEDDYEEIIRQLRTRTTTEILIQNDPVTPNQKAAWHDRHSWRWMSDLASRWGIELVDVRSAWRDHVQDQKLNTEDLLQKDRTHLNERGNFVWAEATLRHLIPRAPPAKPPQLVRTLVVGKDVQWKGQKLTLTFTGNRVDVVAARGASERQAASVRIDGKAPSQWPELYAFSRPNADPNRDWPWQTGATIHVDLKAAPLLEEWTVVFTRWQPAGARFGFDVIGSKTGFDGSGRSDERFVSRSKRIVLSPEDWFIDRAIAHDPALRVRAGYKVTFSVRPLFVDTYVASPAPVEGRSAFTTLAQGLPNGKHTLELHARGERPAIEALRVYTPMSGPLTTESSGSP